ncbi:MAG TPA: hypothetical protein VL860_07155 [Planctomycetota bacterium]|nr:hypothetical protein [Planctomycetota bacterium]
MRITMTSPMLRQRRRAERCWSPRSRLAGLLGVELAGECISAVLPETNGIGSARPRFGADLALVRSSTTRWLSRADGTIKRLPPDGWRSEAGVYGPSTNLCLQSEGFTSGTWVRSIDLPVLDGTVAGPLPTVFRCNDPGTSGFNALSQTLSGLTDGQPHAISLFVKAGTTTGFAIGLYDATAPAFVGRSDFTVSGESIRWSSTSAGSYVLEPVPQSSWYRITIRSTSVVAAHSNRFVIYVTPPGVTQVGYLYLSGAQAQVGALAQPYIPTTTAAASRSADQVNLPTAGLQPAFTVGLVTRILDHAGTPTVLNLPGTAGSNNRLEIAVSPTTGLNVTIYDSTGAAKTWTQNAVPVDRETARWIVRNDNAGGLRAWKNGTELTLAVAGAGTGVRDGVSATLQLGRTETGNFLQGELRGCLQFGRALDPAQIARLQAALMRLES